MGVLLFEGMKVGILEGDFTISGKSGIPYANLGKR